MPPPLPAAPPADVVWVLLLAVLLVEPEVAPAVVALLALDVDDAPPDPLAPPLELAAVSSPHAAASTTTAPHHQRGSGGPASPVDRMGPTLPRRAGTVNCGSLAASCGVARDTMWRPHHLIRPDERRDAVAAFLVLFGFIASHTMLETARDALFLARIPATHLPAMFLAIAVLSFAVSTAQRRLAGSLGGRVELALWTAVAAVVTFGFWLVVPTAGAGGLYALYIWSGLLGILVLVHFWTLLGATFSITQAKRLYGVIGAGSVLGALVGSGAAGLAARTVEPRALLLVASLGFLATALLPLRFTRQVAPASPGSGERTGLLEAARFVVRHAYAGRVASLLVIATVCVTFADYLFKSAVAAEIAKEELAAFLGTVSFALNLASLVVQVGLVPALVRRFGVGASLAVLPLLLLASGVGMALVGTLAAAVAIKTVDGSLRYSLHRTASELAYFPLGDEARSRTRSFVDLVGHRGGQAVASIAILAAGALGAAPALLAMVLVALAAVWAWLAIALRGPYLELFRSRLRGRRIGMGDEELHLDLASLETLVRALGSENDNEVLAALDVLDREGKVDLVPALILYHPSELVLSRALDMFTRAKRRGVVPVIDRLSDHPSPTVRAALLAARSVLDEDPAPLLARLEADPAPEVRAAIVVNLVVSGALPESEGRERVEAILREGAREARIALAEAIGRRAAGSFAEVLIRLADSDDVEVRLAAVRAIGRAQTPGCVPLLIRMLSQERLRPDVERILVETGGETLEELERALADRTLPAMCRVRIPQTLARLDAERAAPMLLEWLTQESEGAVRFQILRALGQLVRRIPSLALDRALLDRTIEATVRGAYGHLERRLTLQRGAEAVPSRRTPGHEALVQLLADEEINASQRLFSMLALAYRSDDFHEIHRGLRSGRKDARATSMELIDAALPEPLRTAVVGLVDDVAETDRIAAAGRYHSPSELDYEGALADLLGSSHESIREITAFHVGELGLVALAERMARLPDSPGGDVRRARELLELRRAS